MSKKPVGTLWLFSSDNRDLYVQDCLSVLALPSGAVQRFRYQRKWISLGENVATTDDAWEKLKGMDVAVCFVAARSIAYGRAVYVPLRRGTVVRAVAEGDFLFVDFRVGDYLSAADPEDKSDRARRQTEVIDATDEMRAKLGGRYPKADYGDGTQDGGYSAVLVNEQLPNCSQDETTATRRFTAAARIMDDLLSKPPAGTAVNRQVFMRLLGVRRSWPASSARVAVKKGGYRLRAGKDYQLDTLEFATDSTNGTVTLALPPMLIAATSPEVPLASSYDMHTFSFVSAPKENDNRGEILGEVRASGSTPVRARVPVVVKPRITFTVLNCLVVLGSVVTAFIVAMLASRGILWEPSADASDYYMTFWDHDGIYVAYSPVAFWVSVGAAIAAGVASAGAVFRRRFGLDSK